MKRKLIYISCLVISLFSLCVYAQEDSINLEAQTLEVSINDSLQLSKVENRAGNLFVGVDLFTPSLAFFGDRKGAQAMISYRVYKKWNAVAEFGFEKNHYDDLDWDIDVDGMYFKLGFNWFISQDHEDLSNGFYTGLRFAYAMYDQRVNKYPIRLSNNQVYDYGSFPTENVSAYWAEIVLGARVRLLSNFYVDFSVRPEIYLGSKKQEGLEPLVIPGYGKDVGPINFSAFWGLTYKIF